MYETIKERRRHVRRAMRTPLQYKSLKSVSETASGALIRDIGEGGVRFIGNEFISLSDRLVLNIMLPTPYRSIKAIAKVAWIKKVPMGDQYEIGNQFLNLTEEDKRHLRNCLEK